jgi:putative nucleotidyltransferase with HDIG domain
MKETDDTVEMVDIGSLRIGMFVELEVGWLAHPFPTGSFKLSSDAQIATIRALGLQRVRVNKTRSESQAVNAEPVNFPNAAVLTASAIEAAHAEAALRLHRADLLASQQRSLIWCEKRFGETARQYRKVLELIPSQPRAAADQCTAMVNGFVTEMVAEGESAIRLLSETAGDKSSLHPVNVTIVSLLLGKAMGLEPSELVELGLAAFLHDVGKAELPDRVRWLEENFSTAEYKLFQEHVALGVRVGRRMDLPAGALTAIAQHHELIDGSGFPSRVRGDSMTQSARILALVNRYDNLCNPIRPSTAMTPHESLAMIFAQLKTRFDAATLSAFIRMMGVYPPGSIVQLVDDRFAIVVSVNSARPLKPRVMVHDVGVSRHEVLILDLEHAPQVGIRRSLKPAALPASSMDFLAPRQRVGYFFEQALDTPNGPVE